jgi:hypothetical protein
MMLNQSQSSKYIVEFFHTERNGTPPKDSMFLKAVSDSDAVEQANWLACRTYCHHFQVRAVTQGVHTVIHRASALARVGLG